MVSAKSPPDLRIPHSTSTVDVSIIDTTAAVIGLPAAYFVEPEIPGLSVVTAPCYGFLIKHRSSTSKSKYDTFVFDLGVRVDWENSPKSLVDMINGSGASIEVEKDVATILRENGQDLNEIGGIMWSHHHFDHTGDPSTFPSGTDLLVGPGFKSAFVPGWPTVPDSGVAESAYEGRDLVEVDFAAQGKGLKIGRYEAIDLYGDGSFYLLDTPGHAVGHICALARTTADPPTFMFLGGDIAHHGGEFRPTEYLPLPDDIKPNPLYPLGSKSAPRCPGEIFEALHPKHTRTEAFMQPKSGESAHVDGAQAKLQIEKMGEFDGYDSIFPVIAHDQSLYDVVDFYPKPANDWKAKGWKTEGTWRFLRDFETGKEEYSPQYEFSFPKKA
nr:hypothetical protein B0A51_08723 [Rachicladosporium sp. CCFEE 5018]